jgi:16S rRNA (adenine1518-N6/adenine1519-N6)-dimethyltransferase
MTRRRPPDALPRPRKRFAQHFLHDRRALERIVEALAPDAGSVVVEIGPGRGVLTDALAVRAGRVIAVEIDRDLAALLRTRYADRPHVQVVEGDALTMAWDALAGGPYLLAGNLPYNLTTPLLFKALERPMPERAVFLVQWEVAQRMVAEEGRKEYGALTVNLRIGMSAEIIAHVAARAFHPRPGVDSAIVRLTPHPAPLVSPGDAPRVSEFVQNVFAMRRKQLQRVLRALKHWDGSQVAAVLATIGLDPAVRAETLSAGKFVELFQAVEIGERPPDRG